MPVSRWRRPGGRRGERERGQVAVVDVGFDGEEGVVAGGVVPVLGSGAHDADPAGQRLVGFLGERERGVRVGADEHGDGAGGVGLVAGVREAPAAQERVVAQQLVVVVGGAAGEVELDQQIEGEVDRGDAQLEREVGLDLGERIERDVDDRLLVGERRSR